MFGKGILEGELGVGATWTNSDNKHKLIELRGLRFAAAEAAEPGWGPRGPGRVSGEGPAALAYSAKGTPNSGLSIQEGDGGGPKDKT